MTPLLQLADCCFFFPWFALTLLTTPRAKNRFCSRWVPSISTPFPLLAKPDYAICSLRGPRLRPRGMWFSFPFPGTQLVEMGFSAFLFTLAFHMESSFRLFDGTKLPFSVLDGWNPKPPPGLPVWRLSTFSPSADWFCDCLPTTELARLISKGAYPPFLSLSRPTRPQTSSSFFWPLPCKFRGSLVPLLRPTHGKISYPFLKRSL